MPLLGSGLLFGDSSYDCNRRDWTSIEDVRKLKYPKAVFFIISSEFCERFSFYGMKAILALYLRDILRYTDQYAILIIHSFAFLCYVFPLFGAIISDSVLGKFKTIFYFSIFHSIGNLVIAFGATLIIYPKFLTLLGLVLTAIGVGGIKPCVSAFGGEQFKLPRQEKQLKRFFSVFYFSINIGALLATTVVPILRQDVQCFGSSTCYSLALGIPAGLMAVALVLFAAGKPWYEHRKPVGNVIGDSFKCIFYALRKKLFGRNKTDKKPNHWLDYASDKFSPLLIKDVQETLRAIVMFVPVPLYWALADQQGSSWTFQASKMNGVVYNWFTIQPDQLSFLNPLLCLIFIPTFELFVYPLIAKVGLKRPLQYMTLGAILCGSAFVISSYVESIMEPSYAVLPRQNSGQLRIYNGFPCDIQLDPPVNGISKISQSGALQITSFELKHSLSLKENVDLLQNPNCAHTNITSWSGDITLYEEESVSYIVMESKNRSLDVRRIPGFDDVTKAETNHLKIRVIHNLDGDLNFLDQYGKQTDLQLSNTTLVSSTLQLYPAKYNLFFKGQTILSDFELGARGVYTLVLEEYGSKIVGNLHIVTPPAPLHIVWITPQIIVITAAEIFFSVTALSFTYTEAPESMKSFVSAMYSLAVAFGNIAVVFVEAANVFESMVHQFLFFAGLMALNVVILITLAIPYEYKKYDEVNNTKERDVSMCEAELPKDNLSMVFKEENTQEAQENPREGRQD